MGKLEEISDSKRGSKSGIPSREKANEGRQVMYTKEERKIIVGALDDLWKGQDALSEKNIIECVDYIDEHTERVKLIATVKVDGLNTLKKILDNLDVEKIVAEAIKKAIEPELKPCPFCGSEAEQRYRRGELSGYNPPLYGCSNKECILHELNASLDRWNRRSQWISVEGYYEGGEVLAHFPQIVAPEHAIVKKAFLGDNGHWWESGGRCLYMIPDYFQPLPSAPEDK